MYKEVFRHIIYNKMSSAAVLTVMLVLSATFATAQTQQGYVKTKGRLGQNGKVVPGFRLSGATVMLLGGSSTSSAAQGTFSLRVTGGRFTLQKVMKDGYELVDAEDLKTYRCTVNPLVLTMETRLQQRADKSNAARLVRNQLNKKIDRQREEIEQLRAENKLTEEKYQEALNRLLDMEESNQSLVEKMAEEYSKIDYDLVDDFNRQFNVFFLAGELEKADSLLKTRGNIQADVAELQRLQQANEEVSKALEKSKAMETMKRNDLAGRCLKQHELFLMQHQMDSAAYYIDLRSQLDTTNTVWLIEAGRFQREYMANLTSATKLFEKALQLSVEHGDKASEAMAHKELGRAHAEAGRYAAAIESLNMALDRFKNVYGESHPMVAAVNNDLGEVYDEKKQYAEALEHHESALAIYHSAYGEQHESVADTYNDIGLAYNDKGDRKKALEYLEKALSIYVAMGDTVNPNLGFVYNNLGLVHYYLINDSLSKVYYEKAIAVRLKVYGKELHPLVAESYGNLSGIYYANRKYTEALAYQDKVLSIFKALYGEHHPRVAWSYNTIGMIYKGLGDSDKALEHLMRTLSIDVDVYGENSEDVAWVCLSIAETHMDKKDFEKATEYLNRAQIVCDAIHAEQPSLLRQMKNAHERLKRGRIKAEN